MAESSEIEELKALLEQQRQINDAILTRLAELTPVEVSVGTISLSEELDQNRQLILILKNQGVKAWSVAHKAVMTERKVKMKRTTKR